MALYKTMSSNVSFVQYNFTGLQSVKKGIDFYQNSS